jgi:hypothetical protein
MGTNWFSDLIKKLSTCDCSGIKTVTLVDGNVDLPLTSNGVESAKRDVSKSKSRGITIEGTASSTPLTLDKAVSYQTDVKVNLGNDSTPVSYTSVASVGTNPDASGKYQAYLNGIQIYSVLDITTNTYPESIFNKYGVGEGSTKKLYLLHSSDLVSVEKGTLLTGAANSNGNAAVPIDIPLLKLLNPATGEFADPTTDSDVTKDWTEIKNNLELKNGSAFSSPTVKIQDSKGNTVTLNLKVKSK